MDIPLHVIFVEAWIKKDNLFLLAKRSSKDDQAAGKWAVPGGKVEADKTHNVIEDAIQREVMEEVGLNVNNARYFSSRAFVRSSGHHVVALSFLVDYVSGEAAALEDQDEVKWASLQEAKQLLDDHWKETLSNLDNFLKSI